MSEKTIRELIAASSIGQGLRNIRRSGIEAELRELESGRPYRRQWTRVENSERRDPEPRRGGGRR